MSNSFGRRSDEETANDTAKEHPFGEGYELYLTNCKQRNLREGTIRHYRQSYLQFYKFFNEDMPLEDFTQTLYNDYVLHLHETLHNDVSINSYLRDLITTLRFLMQEDYLKPFQMKSICSTPPIFCATCASKCPRRRRKRCLRG